MATNKVYLSEQPTEDIVSLLKSTTVLQHDGRDQLDITPGVNLNDYIEVVRTGDKVSSILVSGASNNTFGQIEDIASRLSGGPYKLKGRDNQLVISNDKSNAPVSYKFGYGEGNGRLLSFSVETDHVTSVTSVTKKSEIDPKDKTQKSEITQIVPTDDMMFQDGGLHWINYRANKFTAVPDATRMAKISNQPLIDTNPQSKSYGKANPLLGRGRRTSLKETPTESLAALKERSYKSFEEAYSDSEKNLIFTEDDAQKVWDELKTRFDSVQQITDKKQFAAAVREMNQIKSQIFHKVVRITKEVDPSTYSSINPQEVDGSRTSMGNPNNTAQSATAYTNTVRIQKWNSGFDVLKNSPRIVILPHSDPNRHQAKNGYKAGEKVSIIEEVQMMIPVSGVRILAEAVGWSDSSSNSAANNMINSVQNKVTASGTVLGSPLLEEGMNIDISGVSNRYRGVWHTKSVKHSINSQGYTCEVELRQKTLPISSMNYRVESPTTSIYEKIQKEARIALKTKSNQIWEVAGKVWERYRIDCGLPATEYNLVQSQTDASKFSIYMRSQEDTDAKHLLGTYQFKLKPESAEPTFAETDK